MSLTAGMGHHSDSEQICKCPNVRQNKVSSLLVNKENEETGNELSATKVSSCKEFSLKKTQKPNSFAKTAERDLPSEGWRDFGRLQSTLRGRTLSLTEGWI